MTGRRTEGRRVRSARRAVLWDLVPSALVVVATAAVDVPVLVDHRAPAAAGAGLDVAVVLSAVCALALLGLPATVRRGRVRRAGIREVDLMTGEEFEERLAELYRTMGYGVRRTGQRGDFGADLVVEQGDERVVVQAKRYRGPVGIEAVQQVVGAASYYGASRAAVVTNSRCTPAARTLASVNEVDLVERDALVRLLALRAEGRPGARAAAAFVRQLVEGARLCAFALWTVLRLACWVLRALWRGMRVATRSVS